MFKNRLYCIAPAPFFVIFYIWTAGILRLVLAVSVIFLVLKFIIDKLKKKQFFTQRIKSNLLFCGVLVLFLIIEFLNGFVGYGEIEYLINFVILAVLLLIYFAIAKAKKLFKVRKIYVILTILLLIVSIIGGVTKLFQLKDSSGPENPMPYGSIDSITNSINPIPLGGCGKQLIF